jgi:hypothetical protein
MDRFLLLFLIILTIIELLSIIKYKKKYESIKFQFNELKNLTSELISALNDNSQIQITKIEKEKKSNESN